MKNNILLAAALLIFGTGYSQVTSGLAAKYSFNSGNANDEIGTNHGSINGATLTTDRFGNVNKAYSFDGISNYIDFGNGVEFEMGQSDFSISLWVQFSVTQFAPILLKRNDSPSYDQYSVFAGEFGAPSDNVSFYYKPSPGGVGAVERSLLSSVVTSAWQHVVIVSSFADSTYMYVNDQYVGSSVNSFTTGGFNVSGANLVAGFASMSGSDYYYNGSIDDIGIYNRALTMSEVNSLYNEPNPMSVGINENTLTKNSISVFPNPNNGEFTIQSQMADVANLINELGQVIETVELNQQNNFSYQVNHLQSGIYFLVGKTIKQKIIVSK